MTADDQFQGNVLATALRRSTGFMLKRAQQILEALIEGEQFGDLAILGHTQFEMLVAAAAVPHGDQITLGRALGIDKSSATGVIDALERMNLLRRKEQPQDRRRRQLVSGARTEAVIGKACAARERAATRLFSVLAASETAELIEHLHAFARISGTRAPEWVEPERCSDSAAWRRLDHLYKSPAFLFRRCGQVGHGLAAEATMPTEFTEGQAKMLHFVCALGRVDMPMLLHAFDTERPTIAVILRALADRGLIEQRQSESDRRRKLVFPTRAGLAAMESTKALWDHVEERLSSHLSQKRYGRMIGLLRVLTETTAS